MRYTMPHHRQVLLEALGVVAEQSGHPAVVDAAQVETAHQFGSEITGVQVAYDNRMLATRSNDETLKLWDVRWVNNLQ